MHVYKCVCVRACKCMHVYLTQRRERRVVHGGAIAYILVGTCTRAAYQSRPFATQNIKQRNVGGRLSAGSQRSKCACAATATDIFPQL